MNVPERTEQLQAEHKRLTELEHEAHEGRLRIEGALLILRELEVPEGEVQPEIVETQPEG